MPLLEFYVNEGQLTLAEKQELVTTLTKSYARNMPAFFVNIVFHELPHGSFFMGGKPTDGKFVRFKADHIAVNWKNNTARETTYLDWIGAVFKERFESKGWQWEYHVTESNRDLWRVQSLVAPHVGTEEMKIWIGAGRAVPWEKL